MPFIRLTNVLTERSDRKINNTKLRTEPARLWSSGMNWDEIGQQQTEDRGRGQSLAARRSFPAGWLIAQGGDSALPQCQSRLAATALPTCVKTKQKKVNACAPHSPPPLVPPRKAPAFIPRPVSSLTVATFLFHLFAPVPISAVSLEARGRRANLNFSLSTDLLAKTFSRVFSEARCQLLFCAGMSS